MADVDADAVTARPKLSSPAPEAHPPQLPGFQGFQGFIENRGQWDTPARFVAQLDGTVVRAEPGAVALQHRSVTEGREEGVMVRLSFEGCAQAAPIDGLDRCSGVRNYILGNDPSTWRRGVPAFGSLVYRELYAGIDLRLHAVDGLLEYDVEAAPGADLQQFVIRCDGASGLSLDDDGSLRIETACGPIVQAAPKTWQILASGERELVPCGFRILDGERFGLSAPGRDPRLALVVDPGLVWSTFLGGAAAAERAEHLAVRSTGEVVVAGYTDSWDFPTTPGAFSLIASNREVFVSCFDPTGSALVFSTFLGGGGFDELGDLALDAGDRIALGGDTQSNDFPTTPGALSSSPNGNIDAFVSLLSADGSDLVMSSYLGGHCEDSVTGLAVASDGRLVAAGNTCSTDFPMPDGGYDPTFNGAETGFNDGFVVWIDPTATGPAQLSAGTFVGTSGYELVVDLALMPDDAPVVVSGGSTSTNFPTTPGAWDETPGGHFIVRLSPDGTTLAASTHFKGVTPVQLARLGNDIVVAGTAGAAQPTPGVFDAVISTAHWEGMVARFSGDLTALEWLSYAGGADDEFGFGLSTTAEGDILLCGQTQSSDLPVTPGAWESQSPGGFSDGFLMRISGDGTSLIYGTYLSNPTGHVAIEAAVEGADHTAFIAGDGATAFFPVTHFAYDTSYNGPFTQAGSDAFVARLNIKPVWHDLGAALAGSLGVPTLSGDGSLYAGEPVSLLLRHAKPHGAATLIVGLSAASLPFKGGTLVPATDVLLPGLPIAANGQLIVSTTWPAGVPSDQTIFLQCWIPDAAAPLGFAASNALSATTP